ncbi:hypothetical protein [Capnocytophaga stomatis]|nr:hypothetical protein [Capnocytophaga stomatis]
MRPEDIILFEQKYKFEVASHSVNTSIQRETSTPPTTDEVIELL